MAAMDLGPVTDSIVEQLVPLALIGGAVLLVFAALFAYRQVRSLFWDDPYEDYTAADWEMDGGGMINENSDGTVDVWYSNTDRTETFASRDEFERTFDS